MTFTRRKSNLLLAIPLTIFLMAWVRSCFVSELYSASRQWATWPDGSVIDLQFGSDKPDLWASEGHPPVVETRGYFIESGYGRLRIGWDTGEECPSGVISPSSTRIPVPDRARQAEGHYQSAWVQFPSSRWLAAEDFAFGSSLARDVNLIGFRYQQRELNRPGASWTESGVSNSYWLPCLLPGLPLALRYHRLRRRYRHGLCQQCGYDLRASTTRCPECGQPIPVAAGGHPN